MILSIRRPAAWSPSRYHQRSLVERSICIEPGGTWKDSHSRRSEFTIIGIMPPKFRLWTDIDVYTSLGQGEPLLYNDRTIHSIACIARLKPDVSVGQAQGELNSVQANLDRLYPTADRNLGTDIVPLKESIVGDVREHSCCYWERWELFC